MLAWVLGTTGLGLLAVACALWLTVPAADRPPVGNLPPTQPLSPPPQLALSAAGATGQPVSPTPTRLRLPEFEVDAPIVPVAQLPDGALVVPHNPHVLGWWHAGARPDSPTGTLVIVGHVDTAVDGPGALFKLSRTRPGQHIIVDTTTGSHRYVITALRDYRKTDLPAEVFATTGRPRLVMITCGGPFNPRTRQYADNIVAYAIPN